MKTHHGICCMTVCLLVFMLEHFKNTPSTFFKHVFSVLIKKCTWSTQITNINVNVMLLTYCGSTQCYQPVWGHSHQCIHYFGCKRAVNIALCHLFCTFIQDRLVKNIVYTLQRICLTQCLLLSRFGMYR